MSSDISFLVAERKLLKTNLLKTFLANIIDKSFSVWYNRIEMRIKR